MLEIFAFIINNLRNKFVFVWFKFIIYLFDSHKFIILRRRERYSFIDILRKLTFRLFLLIVTFVNNRIVIITRFV